jgi:hypothetical protein
MKLPDSKTAGRYLITTGVIGLIAFGSKTIQKFAEDAGAKIKKNSLSGSLGLSNDNLITKEKALIYGRFSPKYQCYKLAIYYVPPRSPLKTE